MKKKYVVYEFNRKTELRSYFQTYSSRDEFIDSFPFAERQCIIQVKRSLEMKNEFVFSDMDCPCDYLLECRFAVW